MVGGRFIASGSVTGVLYALPGGAGLVSGGDDSQRVIGDLYQVTPEHLKKLDELDELDPEDRSRSNRHRSRVLVRCLNNPGDTWEAWAWVWTGETDRMPRIESGDWLKANRPILSERLGQYPWFTLIGLICLLLFPLGLLRFPPVSYFKSPFAVIMYRTIEIGSVLSPFAAMYSLWLARRRGERDGLFGCLFVLAILGCILVTSGLVSWWIQVVLK